MVGNKQRFAPGDWSGYQSSERKKIERKSEHKKIIRLISKMYFVNAFGALRLRQVGHCFLECDFKKLDGFLLNKMIIDFCDSVEVCLSFFETDDLTTYTTIQKKHIAY